MPNKKILVIEDDPDVRLGYNVLLKAHGYDTCFAPDSISAMSEARRHLPDAIILDLGLPAGDGFLVLERFRTHTYLSLVPVVVVSGRDVHTNRPRALQSGAKAYLQKPWNDKELLAILSELLGQPELVSQANRSW